MIQVKTFVFNPFSENTYVLYEEASRDALIIDPGCYTEEEEETLAAFIIDQGLRPVRLINTHCHLDHVFGNPFVQSTWGLNLEIHEGELPVLVNVPNICKLYGIPELAPQPKPGPFIQEGQSIDLGDSKLIALFTPGHSPASLSFYCADSEFVIAGDALFQESIGRTDLPGGNHKRLLESIKSQLFTLPDQTLVYSGHGETTTIGHEKSHNPFF